MAQGLEAELLRDLALEGMGLRTERRQRGIGIPFHGGPGDGDSVFPVMGEDGEELDSLDVPRPGAEEGSYAPARARFADDYAGKLVEREEGYRVESERTLIHYVPRAPVDLDHIEDPRYLTASDSKAPRGEGM